MSTDQCRNDEKDASLSRGHDRLRDAGLGAGKSVCDLRAAPQFNAKTLINSRRLPVDLGPGRIGDRVAYHRVVELAGGLSFVEQREATEPTSA
jgi:hypothetical protein